jgi:hypothetical protein
MEMTDSHDIESIVLCATNEGALYPRWCAMARDRFNQHDGAWADVLRPYVRQLVRDERYEGSTGAETINTAAAAVRDYYLRHVQEMRTQPVRDFAHRIAALGFRVYIADEGKGKYGCITDEAGKRVLSFSFNDGGSLGGNYGPPSRESGTGWRMNKGPYDLRTAEDVHEHLNARPPEWCGKGWRAVSTAAAYLEQCKSSRFTEVTAQPARVIQAV